MNNGIGDQLSIELRHLIRICSRQNFFTKDTTLRIDYCSLEAERGGVTHSLIGKLDKLGDSDNIGDFTQSSNGSSA